MISRWFLLLVFISFPATAKPACAHVSRVALTFDDGPHQYLTPRVLAALDVHDAKATFFLVGNRIRGNATLVRAMHAAGHEIGTHTQDHPDLQLLTPAAATRQIAMARDAVSVALPGLPLPLWRAPYGSLTRAIVKNAASLGLTHVSWTLDLRDYIPRPTLATEILQRLAPGDIVLLHDIQPATVRQLPHLLQSIADRGYQMVTVTDLSSPQSCVINVEDQTPDGDELEIDLDNLIP